MKASLDRIYRKLFCCGGHGVHSPFVFSLITHVIEEKRPYYCYESLHTVRLQLSQSQHKVVCRNDSRAVSRYLHTDGFTKREDEFLFRLANYFRPATIVVAGSGLGLTPLYLTAYSKKARCMVFEPEPSVATIASALAGRYAAPSVTVYELSIQAVCDELFKKYVKRNVHPNECVHAQTDILSKASSTIENLSDTWSVDMMVWGRSFMNDAENDWLDTFERFLLSMHDKSIFVIPDIHASRKNRNCWQAICAHPKATVTLDLHSLGVVFFDPKLHRKTYKGSI